jgi:hypothetical protein
MPADLSLFWMLEELAGLHISQESLKDPQEGVVQTIAEEVFATAFRQWLAMRKVYLVSGNYDDKSWKINTFLFKTLLFDSTFRVEFDSTSYVYRFMFKNIHVYIHT